MANQTPPPAPPPDEGGEKAGKTTFRDERNDALKEEHRAKITEMYLRKKMSQVAIAAELEISQATVSRDIAVIKKRWQKESLQKVEAAQAERIAELSLVKREAWGGWYKSQNMIVSAKGDIIPAAVQDMFPGDPRMLEQVQKAIALEAKILGLEAADTMIKLGLDAVAGLLSMGVPIKDLETTINQMVVEKAKVAATHKQHSVRSD
jgi:hypothetical protein